VQQHDQNKEIGPDVRLTEFASKFLLNPLFILFFLFFLLVFTLGTRDGVWCDMMVTQITSHMT